jgi:CMP-N-acetylneuraminic acid synthetase
LSTKSRSVTAVIPVKANSSRLPGKNILPFGTETLLHSKIRQLQSTTEVQRILVTSDSAEMLEVAESLKCDVDLRPSHFADESRPFPDFMDYISQKVFTTDMLWACVTSPMVGPKLYSQAIQMFPSILDQGYDSIVSLVPFRHFMFDADGPINFGTAASHRNSQDLDLLHQFTNGIVLAPLEKVREWRYNFGPRPFRFEIAQENAIDIDTYVDYVVAKALFEEFGDLL